MVHEESPIRRPLARAIEVYEGMGRWEAQASRKYFKALKFKKAVEMAGRGEIEDGKIHPHFDKPYVDKAAMKAYGERLMKKAVRRELKGAANFHDLLVILEREAKAVYNVGPLMVYDAAVSIGANRGHEPEWIYLHAGALKGAKALVRHINGRTRLAREDLPPWAQELLAEYTPGEIEDILCELPHHLR